MPSCLKKRNYLIFADLFKVSSSIRYLQLKSVFLVLYYTFVSIRNPSEEVLPYLYSISKWDAGKPPYPHTTSNDCNQGSWRCSKAAWLPFLEGRPISI